MRLKNSFRVLVCAASLAVPQLKAKDWYVANGGSVQSAIDSAQPGDTVTLEAGATFIGSVSLPDKIDPSGGPAWITIRSSKMSLLPLDGNRVKPSDAVYMPKLVSPTSAPSIYTGSGAHNYRLVGLEIFAAAGIYVNQVVSFGTGMETSLGALPYNLELDRVYIHGDPVAGGKRGVGLNCKNGVVRNSYISDFKSTYQDAQAIAGWNGPGPYTITNNYLQASGENIMFGGATPPIPGVIPSDIKITHNYLHKPATWNAATTTGPRWTLKNLFELKSARRVLFDGNILENNWQAAIWLTVRTEYGRAPQNVVEDVTITRNIIRRVSSGISISGNDYLDPLRRGALRRLLVKDNIFEDVGAADWGGNGRLFVILDGADGVTIDHNTAFQSTSIALFDGIPSNHFTYTNNITHHKNGIWGSGLVAGIASLTKFASGNWAVNRNVFIGGIAYQASYPYGNYYPNSVSEVGFIDYAGKNFQLSAQSPYRGAGTDGLDIGANVVAVRTATLNVLQGRTNSAAPPPPPSTPPPSSPPPSTTPPQSTPVTADSIWDAASMPTSGWKSDQPVTLGVKFRSDIAGKVTGIRFWKSSGNDDGNHIGLLYTATGVLLAQAPFTTEDAAGWQEVKFATPVVISANTTYVAAYFSTSGWSSNDNFFLNSGADAPPLHALKNGVDGTNGLYSYGATPQFPTTSRSANYGVDLWFAK